jgi:hypothetical protein
MLHQGWKIHCVNDSSKLTSFHVTWVLNYAKDDKQIRITRYQVNVKNTTSRNLVNVLNEFGALDGTFILKPIRQ